jgi:23S rRNA (cytosine1962-C5)-methyltransferase
MKAIKRGGFLATASCSHFATEEDFKEAIRKASVEAGVKLKLLSATGPAPDHPELIGVPETKYLKFFIYQVF